MSNFIKEHINIDTIYDLGKVYTQELGNSNAYINKTGVKLSNNRTLLLELGLGTTFPVIGEYIPDLKPTTDYLSMDVYKVPDSMRTLEDVYKNGYDIDALGYTKDTWHKATREDRSNAAFRFITMKRMKERQALTLDVISYNSQGMVQFGEAKSVHAPILLDLDTFSFGSIDRQFSIYNMAKISREITAVMFNDNGELCLAVNKEEIRSDFRGVIEYEILDTSVPEEVVIEKKRILITKEPHDIDYIPLTEGFFIDTVYNTDIDKVVEIIQSTCESTVVSGNTAISKGEWFALNKTSQNIKVTLKNGDVLAIDPFGIVKTGASQPVSVTTFKHTYTRPSTVSGNVSEGLLYKDRKRFDKNLIGGYFLENVKEAIYKITPSKVLKISGNGSGYFVGPFRISANFDDIKINQFGDNDDAIYAIRINDTDIYFDGDDVFAKKASDIDFSQVIMPDLPDENGVYSATVGNITFSTTYKIYSGLVHRDKEFMYESNFLISRDAVVGEVVGRAYPTSFFRVTRQNTDLCGDADKYPLPDGHVNSKNYYKAGEVVLVRSRDDGSLSVANNKTGENDTITYSYLAVAGKISDRPMVVESFGFVSRDTMQTISSEHFLSTKIRDSRISKTRKRYSGSIERELSPYNVMWIKLRFAGTDESIFLFEQEYDDEHACHLGHSSYLDQRSGCREPADVGVNKLTWTTNALEYTQLWSTTGNSVVPANIQESILKLNKAITSDYLGVAGSLATRSIDNVDGIGVTALSAQTDTKVFDTTIIRDPEIIRFDKTLHNRFSVVTVPKVGFFYYTKDDISIENISSYTEEGIIEPFKRGILIRWSSHTLKAYLEYRPKKTNVYAVYVFTDLETDTSITIEQPFPDGATSSNVLYEVDKLYKVARGFDDSQKCIPMYLANTLVKQYGYVQNIVGVWDESSGVIIDDASISFEDTVENAGHKLVPKCSGAEPIDIVDHYAMISVYKTGKPYNVSEDVRVCVSKQGVINGLGNNAIYEADELFKKGKESDASKRIIEEITKNINSDVKVQVSPVLFGMQGPWKNPIDYVTPEEKMLLSGKLSYTINPKSRIILRFKVGPDNVLHLNMKGRLFDEMYKIIDGYVEEEVIIDNKKTPIQRGKPSYSLKYVNHAGAGILLDRNIVVDLEAYPARLSYPSNNLIRELISPVREDGFSKKMDARAVYVRFDTRYISEDIHSYYDKFIEAPTALTCDLLPEEAILNRDHVNDHSLYKNLTDTVYGNDLIATGGEILLSFDNNTDKVQTLTPFYANTKYNYPAGKNAGVASFKLDDTYRLMKKHLLFCGLSEENPEGRHKLGGKFVNAEIEGE